MRQSIHSERTSTRSTKSEGDFKDADSDRLIERSSCLGLTNYISRFVPQLAEKAAPLCAIISKDSEQMCKRSQQTALDEIQAAIFKATLLKYFNQGSQFPCNVMPASLAWEQGSRRMFRWWHSRHLRLRKRRGAMPR